jgi:hypothetical protein
MSRLAFAGIEYTGLKQGYDSPYDCWTLAGIDYRKSFVSCNKIAVQRN